jgi:hypothetical protein
MTNPSKDPKFNDALKKMIAAKPTQNKDLKLGEKRQPKPIKKPKPWSWERD